MSEAVCGANGNAGGRTSVVGIATCYGLEGWGFERRYGQDVFSSHSSISVLGSTHFPDTWVAGLFSEGKAVGAWR